MSRLIDRLMDGQMNGWIDFDLKHYLFSLDGWMYTLMSYHQSRSNTYCVSLSSAWPVVISSMVIKHLLCESSLSLAHCHIINRYQTLTV